MTQRDFTRDQNGIGRRAFLGGALMTGAALGLSSRPAFARAEVLQPRAEPKVMPVQRRWGPPPPQVPAREGVAPLPGANLWFWDTGGDGEPIVLLHPGTGSAAVWGYQQPVFAKAGYRVIAYSRRGHTNSDGGAPDNLGTGADDLNSLLDFLKVKRAHLVGSAAGGFIVPDFALAYPDRLLSMTIACSQGGVTEPAYRSAIQRLNPDTFSSMPASFRELGPTYRAGNPSGVEQWEALERSSRSGTQRIRQPSKHRLMWADIEQIRTPALVFTGGADLYMPVPQMLDYASHLKNVETAVLSESGHSGYWEQPEAFNALVLDFVRRHHA